MSVRRCEVCRFRNYAERKPKSLLAHIWRWHTGWCPGWKSYIKEREAEQTPSPTSPTDSWWENIPVPKGESANGNALCEAE